MNILFTCAGRRKYLVDYFRGEVGPGDKLLGADMTLSAPALAACDKGFKVPSVYADDYTEQLLALCRSEKVDLLISLNDMELPILAKSHGRFAAIGTTVVLGDSRSVDICSDKWLTVEFAESLGIAAPASYLTVADATAAVQAGAVNYPLIVKPRWGSASFGLHVVNSDSELAAAYQQCFDALKLSHLAQFAGSEQSVIIQQYIQGSEYGVDIFNDLSGRYHGLVAKKKLAMRSGETDKAVTVDPDLFADEAQLIGEQLGHIGNLDCDFLEGDDGFYLLEMNPRFGGGYPFSHEAGGNLVKLILDSHAGKPLAPIKYETNKYFAKCDTLVAVNE